MNFNELNENSSQPSVKKGQRVHVTLTYLEGKPVSTVEAHDDSWVHEGEQIFSFLFGGDMMMLARYDNENRTWFSK